MVIFLYGADSYRSKQKLDEIIAHYKAAKKSGLSLIQIDAANTSFQDFYSHLKISSMFTETKLAIVKNVFSQKKFQEDFLTELAALEQLKDVVVIYEAGEVDQRVKLFKTLVKVCKSQECNQLDLKRLKLWAVKEFQAQRAAINGDALDMLVSYTGNDLWRLSREIKKLADYRQGATVNHVRNTARAGAPEGPLGRAISNVIKKGDIELLVKPSIETDIFKTIDALAQKNKKQALVLMQKHIDSGEAPLYLLSMIAWQFKNLLIVKELAEKGLMYASIVKKSGLHPFVVKKNYYICNQFSFEELKRIYQNIFKVDSDIKTGRIEAETALDIFVASI